MIFHHKTTSILICSLKQSIFRTVVIHITLYFDTGASNANPKFIPFTTMLCEKVLFTNFALHDSIWSNWTCPNALLNKFVFSEITTLQKIIRILFHNNSLYSTLESVTTNVWMNSKIEFYYSLPSHSHSDLICTLDLNISHFQFKRH